MAERFADREEAGRALAERLDHYRDRQGLIVLGLPRGGVPVASIVARELDAPMDIMVVRKVGIPGHSEVAMGAIASIAGSIVTVQNADILRQLGGSEFQPVFEQVAAIEREELLRRQREYRDGQPPLRVEGKTVILVDDGLATGATMRAAIMALQPAGAAHVVVAVPVGAADTCEDLSVLVDEVVCVLKPHPFWAVGQAYLDFAQTTDDEVRRLLGDERSGLRRQRVSSERMRHVT